MKVLVACEFSGIVRDAFRARGHDAVSCDLDPTERDGPHIQGDVIPLLNRGWDLLIAHPPCTYLTNAGVRHLHSVVSRNGKLPQVHGTARFEAMRKAAEFFLAFKNAPIDRICIENPIPHHYATDIVGKYDQLVQPWMFGHDETKAVCLWLKGLPKLRDTKVTYGNTHRVHMMSPGPNRAKERSRFFTGIAAAMATQWGGLS